MISHINEYVTLTMDIQLIAGAFRQIVNIVCEVGSGADQHTIVVIGCKTPGYLLFGGEYWKIAYRSDNGPLQLVGGFL